MSLSIGDTAIAISESDKRGIYDHPHYSLLSLPGMEDRTLLVDGFSKTYSMTGWRLGYGVMPQHLISALELLMLNSNSCTCTFIQKAGIAALQGPQEPVQEMVKAFQYRRDILVARLKQIPGIHCLTPPGAFYVFPNIKELPLNSQALADYLLNQAGVALLPGTAFGNYGEGYLREPIPLISKSDSL